MEVIRSTARFGERYALAKYDALHAAAEDAAIFGRALKSNSVRIRLYIDSYREYQKRLDTIMEASDDLKRLIVPEHRKDDVADLVHHSPDSHVLLRSLTSSYEF